MDLSVRVFVMPGVFLVFRLFFLVFFVDLESVYEILLFEVLHVDIVWKRVEITGNHDVVYFFNCLEMLHLLVELHYLVHSSWVLEVDYAVTGTENEFFLAFFVGTRN